MEVVGVTRDSIWLIGAKTMQNDAVTLQCPNDLCKAPNSQTDKFCQRCGTPLIKRYLWAVGEGIEAGKIGNLVAERYLLKSQRIFLDTKPGLSPPTPESEISTAVKSYLRLFPYRLQVPQVYGLTSLGQREILLLEQAPIYTEVLPPLEGQLMPALTNAWKGATSMRQLNWLWQMAQLWQPLKTEGVAKSLLIPELIRVEGSLVRLLQLQMDDFEPPTLPQLAQLWLQLAREARPAVARFLAQVCLAVQQGELQSVEQLVAVLDQGLAEVGRSQARTLKISTCTDTGPSRQRNEDACYPASGTTSTKPPEPKAIGIVCDGIGGHEGGDVASNLAITTIEQQLDVMPLDDVRLDATTLITALERVICTANDRISQRNDNEHRYGRQRMGTTIVTALASNHEIYIAHVGDSRAYLITRTGCYQVTLDDDVASREVRLGYAFYRDALQQGASGSLVQALGMSATLHPTVQRFVLDADCVFLLCSDGMSDYELVDQCWETEILPVLDGKVDVATASQRLVQIGNSQNGHDNITVCLLYCQVRSSEPKSVVSTSVSEPTTATLLSGATEATDWQDTNTQESNTALSRIDTQLLPSRRSPRRLFGSVLLGIILLLSLAGGLLAYLSQQGRLPRLTNTNTQSPSSSQLPVVPALKKGALISTTSQIELSRSPSNEEQAIASPTQKPASTIKDTLPAQSVLQVIDIQLDPQQGFWLNLKVCLTPDVQQTSAKTPAPKQTAPTSNSGKVQPSPTASNSNLAATASRPLQPRETGWIQATEIDLRVLQINPPSPEQLKNCPPLTELEARSDKSGTSESTSR